MWISSSHRGVVAGVALCLAAAGVGMISMRGNASREERTGPGVPEARFIAKSNRPWGGDAGRWSELEREIRGFTVREVIDSLPESPESYHGLVYRTDRGERLRLLFKRYGALEGEAALDDLLSRYGIRSGFAGTAMTLAIMGWLETDREAALDAFRKLVRPGSSALFGGGMHWKGTEVLTGVG